MVSEDTADIHAILEGVVSAHSKPTPALLKEMARAAPEHLLAVPPGEWPEETFLEAASWVTLFPIHSIELCNVDRSAYAKWRHLCLHFRFLPLFCRGTVAQVACVGFWSDVTIRELRRNLEKEVFVTGITEQNFYHVISCLEEAPIPGLNTTDFFSPYSPSLVGWRLDLQDTRNGFLRLASEIIEQAHRQNVSDIHLEPMEDRLRVRFRIDNDLDVMPPIEKEFASKIIEAFKIKANIPTAEISIEQRGRISERTSVGPLDLRVQVTPTLYGQAIVCRLLDPRSLAAVAGKLPFSGKALETVRNVLESYQGMVLVTGPTGSGKSTTLLKIITSLDRSRLKIVTIEEPVEYALDGIPQTDVSTGKLSFATALKADLRNDPDVILVGEIRDLDTAKIAIQAAQTGHLLLSTLHTNNTTETISRLLTMGCDFTEIRSSVSCVVAQRLVKRLCPRCKAPSALSAHAMRLYQGYGLVAPTTIFSAAGCTECRNEGTHGRIPVFEILHLDESLKALITPSFDSHAFRKQWTQQGGESLARFGLQLVTDGEVDISEIAALSADISGNG